MASRLSPPATRRLLLIVRADRITLPRLNDASLSDGSSSRLCKSFVLVFHLRAVVVRREGRFEFFPRRIVFDDHLLRGIRVANVSLSEDLVDAVIDVAADLR